MNLLAIFNTCFGECCRYGDLRSAKALESLAKEGFDPRVNRGYALKYASVNGHLDIVKYLIEETGLGPDDICSEKGEVLILTARAGQCHIVEYLATKTEIDSQLCSRMVRNAAYTDNVQVVKYLLECVGVKNPGIAIRTALRIASVNSSVLTVKYLTDCLVV